MKTNQKWMMAAAALVTLAFANCSGPAYYDDNGNPVYTASYYNDNGEKYYNTIPLDPCFNNVSGKPTMGYFHHGVYHPGDFRQTHYRYHINQPGEAPQ